MNPLNDLAIILTDLIATDLTREFMSGDGDRKNMSPSYYHIRRTILNTLNKYFKIAHAEVHHDHMEMYDNMSPNELSKMSLYKAKNMLMEEIVNGKFIYHRRQRFDYYHSDRFAVAVLDINSIDIDSEKVDWNHQTIATKVSDEP